MNDSPVALPDEPSANWRHFRAVDVAGWLQRGENRLRAEVRNKRGPALLSLRLEVHSSEGSWPASCGWHPWFRRRLERGRAVELDLDAEFMERRMP